MRLSYLIQSLKRQIKLMIKIVTDSTSDIPQSIVDEYGIEVVPLNINIEGKDYQDGVTIQKDEFYEFLVSKPVYPKTSQPSPNDFLKVFNQIKETNDECICITLSSRLSGTYQSAILAKELCEYEGIHIIDSLSASAGELLLIEEAIKGIKANKPIDEIIKTVEELKGHIGISASLKTLEHLKRSGRLSSTSAMIGTLAKIKPIITVTKEGTVDVYAKAIGQKKAMEIVLKELDNIDDNYSVYPLYTYGTNNLDCILSKVGNLKLQEKIQIGPTIGTHVGPEAYGFCFIKKH